MVARACEKRRLLLSSPQLFWTVEAFSVVRTFLRFPLTRVASAAISLCLLSACGINLPSAIPTQIVVIPTSTLAPILTATPRLTATLLPSDTLIPSPTSPITVTPPLPPPSDTPTITVTPTPPIYAVPKQNGVLNVHAGPNLTSKRIGQIVVGTSFIVLATNSDATWSLLQLSDGSQGWVSSALITLKNPAATIPAMTTPQLTAQAQLGTAISLTQIALAPQVTGTVAAIASGPTHVPRQNRVTDVLAYCDDPLMAAQQNRKFKVGDPVVVFWSWIAQTPQQIQDQLTNAQYNITIDGAVIANWQSFASPITQQADGAYIVYWFVPLSKPAIGTHHIVYQLTWTAPVFDGKDNFGPGTTNPTTTNTCSFSVSP